MSASASFAGVSNITRQCILPPVTPAKIALFNKKAEAPLKILVAKNLASSQNAIVSILSLKKTARIEASYKSLAPTREGKIKAIKDAIYTEYGDLLSILSCLKDQGVEYELSWLNLTIQLKANAAQTVSIINHGGIVSAGLPTQITRD